MVTIQASTPLVLLCTSLFACLVLSIIKRKRLSTRFKQALPHAKPIAAILCIPAGFLLMEIPYNPFLDSMDPFFVMAGLIVTSALFAISFFLGQCSKTSMIAFLCACFIAGTANCFVAALKGQPILPSDIMALQTAFSVSGGYTYPVGDSILRALCLLFAMACLIVAVPTKRPGRNARAANAGVGLVILAAFYAWFNVVDIEKDYGCTVDVWSSLSSYQQHGAALCFLERAQMLTPRPPEDYSPDEAARIRSERAEEKLAQETREDNAASEPDVRPSIIAVMSETFADLSTYPNIDEAYDGPRYLKAIDDALSKGDCYVSAMGGGTCNSEFEFLTGSSMGLLGAGIYPYVLYDLTEVDNLASHLGSIGYETTAIHPAEKQNWRRDRVYKQLGFDSFHDIDSFSGAESFHGMVSDKATYDLALDIIRESDGPQFIFDVTIASHGGYDTGTIAENDSVSFQVNGQDNAEVNEYLSCIQRSDSDLEYLVESLRMLDEPVVLCYFGDHQPGLSEWLAADAFENDDTIDGVERAQKRYVTPFMIWTNDARLKADSLSAVDEPISLNYLGATMLKSAGLPLNEHFAFLHSIKEELPLINLNGYQDAQGTWHWHGETSISSEAYRQLAVVGHSNLFDK